MTMQYDVLAGHINNTGQVVTGRFRLKQLSYIGNGSQAGGLFLFDTTTAPTQAVYQQSGTTVTVTKNAHGLSAGQSIAIGYSTSSGISATDGNYVVASVTTNTFTITDPNSNTVGGGTNCWYSTNGKWLTSYNTLAGTTSSQQIVIPGEGMLVQNGVYAIMNYIVCFTMYYG